MLGIPTDAIPGQLPKLDPTNDEVATGASAGATGGLSAHHLISANTINATVVKASAGRLYSFRVLNSHATLLRYIKFYDKATAPDPSDDVALLKYTHPAWSLANAKGDGMEVFPHGIAFENGISYVLVTDFADNGETAVAANELIVNLTYK